MTTGQTWQEEALARFDESLKPIRGYDGESGYYAVPIEVADALATIVRQQQASITRLEERERRHASMFGVPDGGQYEADWESRAEAIRQQAGALKVMQESSLLFAERLQAEREAHQVSRQKLAEANETLRLIGEMADADCESESKRLCEEEAYIECLRAENANLKTQLAEAWAGLEQVGKTAMDASHTKNAADYMRLAFRLVDEVAALTPARGASDE